MSTRILLLFALLAAFLSVGCDDLTDIDFTVRGAQVTFNVDETDGPSTILLSEADLPTNLQEELDDNDVDRDRVKSIKAETIVCTITGTDNVDFSLIESAELRLSTPGLPTITISKTDLTAVDGREVLLDIRDVQLLDYIKEPTVEYVMELMTNEAVPEPFEVNVRVEYKVTGSVL